MGDKYDRGNLVHVLMQECIRLAKVSEPQTICIRNRHLVMLYTNYSFSCGELQQRLLSEFDHPLRFLASLEILEVAVLLLVYNIEIFTANILIMNTAPK